MTWSMEYLGRGYFMTTCQTCEWQHTGSMSQAQDAAVKHVRTVHQ